MYFSWMDGPPDDYKTCPECEEEALEVDGRGDICRDCGYEYTAEDAKLEASGL